MVCLITLSLPARTNTREMSYTDHCTHAVNDQDECEENICMHVRFMFAYNTLMASTLSLIKSRDPTWQCSCQLAILLRFPVRVTVAVVGGFDAADSSGRADHSEQQHKLQCTAIRHFSDFSDPQMDELFARAVSVRSTSY